MHKAPPDAAPPPKESAPLSIRVQPRQFFSHLRRTFNASQANSLSQLAEGDHIQHAHTTQLPSRLYYNTDQRPVSRPPEAISSTRQLGYICLTSIPTLNLLRPDATMKSTPLIINWHDQNAPIYSAHFEPSGKGRLATAAGDNNVRVCVGTRHEQHYARNSFCAKPPTSSGRSRARVKTEGWNTCRLCPSTPKR